MVVFLIVIFLLLNFLSGPLAEQRNFIFQSFNQTIRDELSFKGDSTFSKEALQLTPDTLNNPSFLQNKSGRIIIPQKFRLWKNNHVASFHTSFVINIFHPANIAAEGMTFVILPSLTQVPDNSHGGFLGLTNSTIDGSPDNRFVAVEFDTFKQPYDPDDNHIGLNINSVNSTITRSLTNDTYGYNLILSPTNVTVFFTVWIDYDGTQRKIQIYMANHDNRSITVPKPSIPVLTSQLDLSKYLLQDSYFGFSASTGDNIQLNCVLRWNLTVEIIPPEPGVDVKGLLLKAGVPCLVMSIFVIMWLIWSYVRAIRKKQRNEEQLEFALKTLPGMPKEYAFKDLKIATCNFDDRNQLGKGGFGSVYGGRLSKEGIDVAVKTFLRDNCQGDFLSELTIINRLRHRNLVPLLGTCVYIAYLYNN